MYEYEEIAGKMRMSYGTNYGAADIYNNHESRVEWVLGINRVLSLNKFEIGYPEESIKEMDPNQNLTLQMTPYNSHFWAGYNIPITLNAEVIRELEIERNLSQQFNSH